MKTKVLLLIMYLFVCGNCWAGDDICCDSNDVNCFSSPGNQFTCYLKNGVRGNCTWYGRYARPDLINEEIGTPHAVDWYQVAENAGFAVGDIPVVGSIAVFHWESPENGEDYGHIAYVESVTDDGDDDPRNNVFHASEMGYGVWDGVHEDDYQNGGYEIDGLIGFIYPVGVYGDDRTDYTLGSQNKKVLDAFLLAYKQHKDIIGAPWDNNGGETFVHEYKGATDQSFSVWIQDFYNPDTDKWYALILNDLESAPVVHLLQGAIRGFYMNDDGPYNYGVAFTEEISRIYANSPDDTSGDTIQPGNCITAQKFKRRKDGQWYNEERRTLVWKSGMSSAEHIPVGEYEVYAESCSGVCPQEGDQIYVIDPWHTGLLEYSYDKPWPLAGHPITNGSTGRYFTKPGTYNFVLHNPDGTRKSGWGLTVQITEGNHQFSGGGLFEPSNLRYSNLTSTSATLLWDKGINADDTGFTWGVYQGSTKIQTVNSKTYTVTGLSPSTTYTFKVTAIDGAEESGFSNVLSLTTPAEVTTYPVDFNFVEKYTSEYVEPFSEAANSNDSPAHQSVYCRGGDLPTVFVRINQVTIPGALPAVWRWYKPSGELYLEESSDIWLDCGSDWWFYQDVDLSGSTDYGTWSVQVILDGNDFGRVYFEFAPCLAPPANAVSSNVTSTSLQVNWDAAPYATGYNIAKKSGDDWLQGGNITTLYLNESGLEPDTTYTYRIFSTSGNYVSENYAEITVTTESTQAEIPAIPQNLWIVE